MGPCDWRSEVRAIPSTIVKNIDEKMIDNMPRYIFGQKRTNEMRQAFDSKVIVRSDDDFGVESLSHFICSFLTKNITWHVIDHLLINILTIMSTIVPTIRIINEFPALTCPVLLSNSTASWLVYPCSGVPSTWKRDCRQHTSGHYAKTNTA